MHSLFISLLQDGTFAAIAAIGFGSISNIPLRAFSACALLAAIGHATRYLLMNEFNWNIIPACFVAALCIGLLSIPTSLRWKCPPECLSAPALLPMIPGMYAYRTVQALLKCLERCDEADFQHSFYLLTSNGLTCLMIIILLVIGITIPIFMFGKLSFKATKSNKK